MKTFLLTLILLFCGLQDSYSQDPVWTVNAPESDWFGTGNTERGMTFNPATGHLIVASRQGGVKPALIDAATGAYLSDLDNTGIAGGTFAYNQIRATEDGQIFTANLTTSSASSNIKIYRWADESSAPSLIYDASYAADTRFGESFGAYGTGNDVTLLLSGSNPGVILKFAWDGTNLTLADEWTVDQNDGRGGFSHHTIEISDDGDLGVMITGSGISPSIISLTDGSDFIPALSSDEVPSGTFNSVMYADFAEFGMQTLIVTGPASSDKKFYAFVPSALAPDVLVKVGEMGPFTANANGNNTGGVVIDDENAMIYIMNTNNVLSAYDVYDFIDYPTAGNLIISEYIEGSSNNKALEITNLGDTPVDLSYYQIMQSSNGNGWQYYHEFAEGAVVDAGDQYVLTTNQIDPAIYDTTFADEVLGFPSPIHFNGDDARALIFIGRTDTTILDVIGDPDNDPGIGWDVAGISAATANHTLVRKPSVSTGNTTPLASFGTSEETSEWIVKDQNDFSNLGFSNAINPVKVTFTVNMATLMDTLQEYHTVQIRGAPVGADVANTGLGSIITWETGSLEMTNIGGDYWQASFDMSPGDVLNYKFWAGVNPETPLINGTEQGWETGDNNVFVLPASASRDTIVNLQWFETKKPPFPTENDSPSSSDSISVYFKVNVGAHIQLDKFDPNIDKIGIRGNPLFFNNTADWSSSAFYLDEVGQNENNVFYAGYQRVHKEVIESLTTQSLTYKYVIENSNGEVYWEQIDDRRLIVPKRDTTIHWVHFSDIPPTEFQPINTTLNFEVNVSVLEDLGYFNPSIDTVFVRGEFNSWSTANQMTFNSSTNTYEAFDIQLKALVGSEIRYKYFIKWDKSRDDEVSPNYLPGITHDGSGWEEPSITGGGDRYYPILDAIDQPKRTEYYNGINSKALIAAYNVNSDPVRVKFSIDMSPALGNEPKPFVAGVDDVYLLIQTPFFALTNDLTLGPVRYGQWPWLDANERNKIKFSDEDSDLIYELELELNLPTLNNIGFTIGYGNSETLTVNGKGFGPGRFYYQYIKPNIDENLNVSWPSYYDFPTLKWQFEDLDWELPPDYSFPNNDGNHNTNNLVFNGDFSYGDSSWVLDYYNGADERGSKVEVINGQLVFSGLTGYSAPFDVQAHQILDTDKLQQDAKYRLTFDAKTLDGSHELFVFLGEIGGAWNRYWSSAHPAYGDNPASNGSGDVLIDNTMRTYTLEAIADSVYSDMYLSFEVDFEPGDVIIDNVKLERIYDDSITNNPFWTHDPNFQAHRDSIPSVHGIAVDGEGKVWVQPYYASETIVMNRDVGADGIPDTLSTRAIYIYHPDGTQASFSPLKVINYANGSTDTLGHVWYPDETDAVDGGSYQGYSGRGITADAAGNIIISSYNRLYKLDYTDGSGIAMVDPSAGCSLTEATTDDANNVYVGCVVGSIGPLVKFAPDLTGEEALVTIPDSFSRDLQVSGDGNTIWWAGYNNGAVHRFSRDDEFSSFGDADTVLRGIKAEVFDIHPITGHLWVGSGSLNDVPADPYEPQRWYAFDVNNLSGTPIPVDTIAWVADPNSTYYGGSGTYDGTYDQARPRALDFSPDGKTAYIGAFAIDNGFQRFTKGDVTVPPPPTDTRKRIDMLVNMKYQELLGNFTNSPEDSVETYVGVYGNFNNWDPTNYAGLAAINDSIYTGEILLDTTMHSELQYRFVIASSTNGIIDIEDNDPVVSSDGQELVNYRWLEVDSSPGLQYSPRVYFSDIGPKEYHLESLPLLSIEQARAQERGSKVMIEGVVTRVTYNFVYLQDGTAGMLLFSRPRHSDLNSLGFWEAASNGEIQVGDRLKVAGVFDEYQGTQELVNLAGWKVISKENELLYTTLDSFDELATNGEAYESQLIRMNNLRFMSTDSTYSYVAYPVMSSNDGSVGYLFMYGANNNPWFGEQFSSKPFSFEGVVRQVLHQGELVYALAPHYREDLKFAGLDNKNMYLGTSYTKEGFKFSNSLSLDNLNTVDSLMSYQFNLKVPKGIRYDSLKLYHSESSPMLVSNFRDSVLRVAVTGSGFITNHHPLLELFFLAEEVGSYSLDLSEVKLNEVRLDEFYPGIVRVDPFRLGDVDDSGEIDAYDAGIVLHQTVGSQIIKPDLVPSWDEGPWFNWRFGAADVDGDGELLAIDATQILKYVVGLIDDFTVTSPPVESVFIESTSDGLIVNAPEGIEGLNILLPEVEGISYSDPEIIWENAASALSKDEGLKIALASTDPKSGEVLKIPYMIGADDRQTIQIISYTNGKRMVHEVQVRGVNVTAENEMGLPEKYTLSQNYPNPFNPTTKIQYALPKAGNVRIDIYSMLGQKVATLVDTHEPAGYHTASFDASQLSSGVYLYKLTTPGFTQTKKMLLIK